MKTVRHVLELTPEQHELLAESAHKLRVTIPELLLALACMELETTPDPEFDSDRLQHTITRIVVDKELPEVRKEWGARTTEHQLLYIRSEFLTKPYTASAN